MSYGLALMFALLGAAIVFFRTRYAVAFYMVIFGSIIVAAFKMGMVHERPRAVKRQDLASAEGLDGESNVESGSVLEVHEERRPASTVATHVDMPGAWSKSRSK